MEGRGFAMATRTGKERQTVQIGNQVVSITHSDKMLWPEKKIRKAAYLQYLYRAAPLLLPFLKRRTLTVIRYPDGAEGEFFYQKNCPDYAPDFVRTHTENDINYIVCDDEATLIWLGNQAAFEFHVPFHTIGSGGVSEIVLDLDPPSRKEFSLAITAALMVKEVLDRLKLVSFVKTSGNKGLQVYVPLPEQRYTYEDTRRFTYFLAQYLVTQKPELFTTERLKKKRGNRLYVDYLQYADGKTIIAPYSVRGNAQALVAAPLYWNEVKEGLFPEQFPMETVSDRIHRGINPFQDFWNVKEKQPFQPVLDGLSEKGW